MSKATSDARAKAVRLCGGGSPSLRRHREDGGGTGEGGGSAASSGSDTNMPIQASFDVMPPPMKVADDKDPSKPDKDNPSKKATVTGPEPLNAQATGVRS